MRRILFIAAVLIPSWSNAQPAEKSVKTKTTAAHEETKFKAPPLDEEGPDEEVQAVACLDCRAPQSASSTGLQRLPVD